MKKLLAVSALTLLSTGAFAQDVQFPGQERWLAQHAGFICGTDKATSVAVPQEFKTRAIMFTYMTTGYSLDKGKFVAGFFENGAECRYTFLADADKNGNLVRTESTAYAVNGGNSTCADGKNYLDSIINTNTYAYLHESLALNIPVADAAAICGEGATTVGLFFKKALKPKID